jgi:urea transporter
MCEKSLAAWLPFYKTYFVLSQWLTPVILATQEAEIRTSWFEAIPGQIVHSTRSRKALHNNRAGRVAQGEGTEFKPQYHKKKKKKKQ